MITNWARMGRKAWSSIPRYRSGVYALFYRGELVYIGRSTNLRARLAAKRKFPFDQIAFKFAGARLAYKMESLAIVRFQPKFNRHVMLPETAKKIKAGVCGLSEHMTSRARCLAAHSRWLNRQAA